MIHTAAKGQGHLVQKLEVEADVQTDGQTDGGNCLSPVPTRHSILRYNRPTSDIYLPRLLSYRVAKRDTGLMVVGCSPRLVNKLIPGYVKKINTKGGNFALMENIAAVQKGMRQYGVPEDELFQPVDLFEARNIKAVVKSLAALARTVIINQSCLFVNTDTIQ